MEDCGVGGREAKPKCRSEVAHSQSLQPKRIARASSSKAMERHDDRHRVGEKEGGGGRGSNQESLPGAEKAMHSKPRRHDSVTEWQR